MEDKIKAGVPRLNRIDRGCRDGVIVLRNPRGERNPASETRKVSTLLAKDQVEYGVY